MSDGANGGDLEQPSELPACYIVVSNVPRSDEPTTGKSVLSETVSPPTCGKASSWVSQGRMPTEPQSPTSWGQV